MFDLERAIADWRRQTVGAGLKSKDTMNELETHLRDDIEQEMRAGLPAEQALKIAIERIGDVVRLKDEFAKIDRAPREILWKLKKFLIGAKPLEIPPMNAFTPGAQQALALAREEAPLLNHDFIGTEHVLLGLLKSQSDIVPRVMRRLGVQSETIRAEIQKIIGPGIPARRMAAEIPYTPRAKRALNLALKEAESLEQQQVKPEHMLLGLLKENKGVAGLVLRNLGVDLDRARNEIISELNFRKGVG